MSGQSIRTSFLQEEGGFTVTGDRDSIAGDDYCSRGILSSTSMALFYGIIGDDIRSS